MMSNPLSSEKLRKLLGATFGTIENPWISTLEAERADFNVGKEPGIKLSGVREIYSRRGRRNSNLGNPINGFECLLKNLEKSQADRVLIHGMADNSNREYCVFTDLEINELIGLLRFPIERSMKSSSP